MSFLKFIRRVIAQPTLVGCYLLLRFAHSLTVLLYNRITFYNPILLLLLYVPCALAVNAKAKATMESRNRFIVVRFYVFISLFAKQFVALLG